MSEPDDAMPHEPSVASVPAATHREPDASSDAPREEPDDRAARRAALRDLAAMIGVEVFY